MLAPTRNPSFNAAVYAVIVGLQLLLLFRYASMANLPPPSVLEAESGVISESPLPKGPPRIPFERYDPMPPGYNFSRILVIPRTKREDVSWVAKELPDLETAIYTVDDPAAPLKVPENKGHEAMAYLTYIIDHYDNMPDIVLFFHAHRHAWHNNDLLGKGDAVETIRHLNSARVWRMGYMNTRCTLDPGCPDWIHLDRPVTDLEPVKKAGEEMFTLDIWRQLFPHDRAPPALSQPCCAQFASSRERIRETPREEYIRLRQWLMETPLDDYNSGRVFEYLWQYIFTRNGEYCPAAHTCYCDGYGLCFGGAVQFAEFESLQREMEFMQKETIRHQAHTFEGDVEVINEHHHRVKELGEEIKKRMDEAWKRGEIPENRELEAERFE